MPPKRKAGGASGAAAASKKPKGNIPVDKGLTEKHSDNFRWSLLSDIYSISLVPAEFSAQQWVC